MFYAWQNIGASFIPYFKAIDEMLQSWHSYSLLIFHQSLLKTIIKITQFLF
jgi:hypothetical protein